VKEGRIERKGKTHLISENHQPVIRLTPQYTPDTLRRMPHRIESEEVVLSNAVGVAEELEASFKDAGFGVLRRATEGQASILGLSLRSRSFKEAGARRKQCGRTW
jgi:hypothetical protein